ncbi:MAG: hypothetical protein LBQ68_07015, partial [Clostridiales bacterium]|nr:hypothetical protein [Clostridiales bacterium]
MKAERLKILELLENGKITADDAANLLEALKSSEDSDKFWDEETSKNLHEKVSKLAQNVEGVSKDVGDRLESVYKEIEPKLRNASKLVVEKTAAIVDEIAKSLNETLARLEEKAAKGECCGEEKVKDCGCGEQGTEAPADNGPPPESDVTPPTEE